MLFLAFFSGLAAAFALSRVLGAQLYGVSPRDPWTFAGVAALIAAIALASAYLPALRRLGSTHPSLCARTESQ